MGVYARLFAALYDPLLRDAEAGRLGAIRQELLAGAHGHLLDVGAGTGANLPHLPPAVTRVSAVEPDPAMAARLRRRVADLPAARASTIEVIDAVAEALPLPTGSVDVVVTTLTLCSVHDPSLAATELRRVLRPEGVLVVLEHVAGAHPSSRAAQRALTPAWRRLARGCHLDRDTAGALRAAGFDVSDLVPRGPGPAVVPWLAGVARPV